MYRQRLLLFPCPPNKLYYICRHDVWRHGVWRYILPLPAKVTLCPVNWMRTLSVLVTSYYSFTLKVHFVLVLLYANTCRGTPKFDLSRVRYIKRIQSNITAIGNKLKNQRHYFNSFCCQGRSLFPILEGQVATSTC